MKQALMETVTLENNITIFGFPVKTFPERIGEAFDSLIEMVPERLDRSYYGVCYMNAEGKLVYIAAVEERTHGEAEKNNCERYTIEKGKYFAVRVTNWRQKVDSINHVFEQMMQSKEVDSTKPCVEWYKNDFEMLCMLKAVN